MTRFDIFFDYDEACDVQGFTGRRVEDRYFYGINLSKFLPWMPTSQIPTHSGSLVWRDPENSRYAQIPWHSLQTVFSRAPLTLVSGNATIVDERLVGNVHQTRYKGDLYEQTPIIFDDEHLDFIDAYTPYEQPYRHTHLYVDRCVRLTQPLGAHDYYPEQAPMLPHQLRDVNGLKSIEFLVDLCNEARASSVWVNVPPVYDILTRHRMYGALSRFKGTIYLALGNEVLNQAEPYVRAYNYFKSLPHREPVEGDEFATVANTHAIANCDIIREAKDVIGDQVKGVYEIMAGYKWHLPRILELVEERFPEGTLNMVATNGYFGDTQEISELAFGHFDTDVPAAEPAQVAQALRQHMDLRFGQFHDVATAAREAGLSFGFYECGQHIRHRYKRYPGAARLGRRWLELLNDEDMVDAFRHFNVLVHVLHPEVACIYADGDHLGVHGAHIEHFGTRSSVYRDYYETYKVLIDEKA